MKNKLLNSRPMMDIQDTYTLRGICMLMIIVHHVIKLMPDCPMTIWRWGDLGTAVFFFISGWGLYCSMEKREKVDWRYLWNNLKKLIVPFIIVWTVTELVFKMIHTGYEWLNILRDGVCLTYPSMTFSVANLWFIKAIVGVYVVSIITFIIVRNRLLRVTFVTLLCCSYIIVAWKVLHLQGYLYGSILCFPAGMWMSAYKEELKNILSHKVTIAVVSLILYIFFSRYDCLPYPSFFKYEVCFAFLTVSLVSIFNIQSKLLYFIGKNSLLFYLTHIAVLVLLTEMLRGITQHYLTILCVVLIVTLALCWSYAKVESLIKKGA